ncbi:WD40/YVTN/BNR-like repeat-containing protein [Pseudomonas baetica]|uniref:WD40/YVTN/BNR-like repeat-containing protein n=1 Tax=Pseudomonas baetica TaxID=674054 RepID=UPI003EEEC77A
MHLSLAFFSLLASSVALAAQPPVDRLERPAPDQANVQQQSFNDVLSLPVGFIAAGRDGLLVQGDGKGHFNPLPSPTSVLLTAVRGQPGQAIWATGHDGLVMRQAPGKPWQRILDGNQINALLQAGAQDRLQKVQAASDASPDDSQLSRQLEDAQFYLDDAQASLDAGPARPLLDLWVRDDNRGWVVGAYGVMLATDDGGAQWRLLDNLPNPERLHLNSVLETAPGVLLVAGEGGRLYRSADAGQHWDALRQLGNGSLYRLIPLGAPGDVLVVGFGGFVARSRDAGVTWQTLPVPAKASLFGGTRLDNGGVLLVGQGGSLLYSEDLQHFRLWRDPQQRGWMAATQLADGSLELAGRQGLLNLGRNELLERFQ